MHISQRPEAMGLTEAEHKELSTALVALQEVIQTKSGFIFLKYLLKTLAVTECPPIGHDEGVLREQLGLYRAGQSVYRLLSRANPQKAASILAQIEKERFNDEISETTTDG